MTDTATFGNPFGFPFTRAEYERALRLAHDQEEHVALLVRLIYEPTPELFGVESLDDVAVNVMDGDLLLLALLSDDLARRVTEYRPELRAEVERTVRDRAAILRDLAAQRQERRPE